MVASTRGICRFDFQKSLTLCITLYLPGRPVLCVTVFIYHIIDIFLFYSSAPTIVACVLNGISIFISMFGQSQLFLLGLVLGRYY